LIPWLEVTVGLPVRKHPAPCRPTAPTNKHDSGPPRSGFRQARRERAAELFAQGRTQVEVARQLDVSRQSAGRWHAGWQAVGATGLQSRGPTGRRPKVADAQLEGIERALLEGALAHGFPTDVWTLDRIAVVIQGLTGVQLSNPSVWRLLRHRLGWTVQRPQRQAKERHEEAIRHWVQQEWPRIK
jgi:transposase